MERVHRDQSSLSMFSIEGYQAFRTGAGVVVRGDRGVLAVSGSDRLTWLQGLLTNDVLAVPNGEVQDSAYLTPQGRMITDLRVISLADRTWLDVPGSLSESLQKRLDGLLFSEDAQIVDDSKQTAIVDVHGPASPPLITRVRDRLTAYGTIVEDAAFGVAGYSLFVSMPHVESVIGLLVDGGAVPTTLETLEVIRVESGRPAFLIDMDDHTIPLEAGIEDRAISFTKGCYVGQEVIVRVMHRGHGRVAKHLVGLRLAKGLLPTKGDAIASSDRDVGHITSAVWSPALEGGIALGYVHRDFASAGSTLSVRRASGELLTAEVTELPFVESVPSAGG